VHLANLGVDASRFLHRVLDTFDIGDLGSDMKVQQLQRVYHLKFAKESNAFEHFGRSQPELGGFAARRRPLARTLRIKLRANSDPRLEPRLLGPPHDHLELVELLDDDYHALAYLDSH
jgi:hypothetical protein